MEVSTPKTEGKLMHHAHDAVFPPFLEWITPSTQKILQWFLKSRRKEIETYTRFNHFALWVKSYNFLTKFSFFVLFKKSLKPQNKIAAFSLHLHGKESYEKTKEEIWPSPIKSPYIQRLRKNSQKFPEHADGTFCTAIITYLMLKVMKI